MISPSNMQWAAIKDVERWYKEYHLDKKNTSQIYRLFGVAGTGKTEIAKFIATQLQLTNVLGAAFSGKAAHQMRVRGFPNSTTIHSLIYSPIEKGMGRIPTLEAQLKQLIIDKADPALIKRLEKQIHDELHGLRQLAWSLKVQSDLRTAQLLILDEVSMVGESIANDLLSFGVPILALGDPAQLPPVADGGYFTNAEPDFTLTEIHRQAKDSAIIRMATMAREDGWVPPGVYKDPSGFDSEVVQGRSDPQRLLNANQILVGHNLTRHLTNKWVRKKRGFTSPYPMKGDRLVCMQNDHEIGVLNGALYAAASDAVENGEYSCDVLIVSDDFPELGTKMVTTHKRVYGHNIHDALKPWEIKKAQCFDWSYAITTHKAQGSQFPHVAIHAEWNRKDSWRQWLYTSLTRGQISNYVILPES